MSGYQKGTDMNTRILTLAVILVATIATNSFATVYTVTAGAGGGMTFTPSSGITMHPGDTIKWVWASGTHTTTSTTIPAGATSWDQPLNSTATIFSYVPTVLGTYNYQCNFHVSSGMIGSFNVVSAAGIAPVNEVNAIFCMYPNPASGSLHMQFNNPGLPVTVIMTDMNGKEVIRCEYNNLKETELNTDKIPNGLYMIRTVQGNNIYKQELVIAH